MVSQEHRGQQFPLDPVEPTLFWRSPNLRYEVHVKDHMPSRDLRENYGAQPHQYVALHDVDPENPNARPSIRRVEGGQLAGIDQFSNRLPKPPAHVMKHVQRAIEHVEGNAATHAETMGRMADLDDIRSDLSRVPHDMAAEDRAHRMFKNLLRSADERDQD